MDPGISGSVIQAGTHIFTWFIGGLLVVILGFIAYWVKRQDHKFDILFKKFDDFEKKYVDEAITTAEFRTSVRKDMRQVKRHLKLNGHRGDDDNDR